MSAYARGVLGTAVRVKFALLAFVLSGCGISLFQPPTHANDPRSCEERVIRDTIHSQPNPNPDLLSKLVEAGCPKAQPTIFLPTGVTTTTRAP